MKDKNLINHRNKRGLTSFKYSAKQLLNPILKNSKYIIIYEIIRNWENIIGTKYKDYCNLEKITLSTDKKQANILVKSYNSSTSFFLNNNSQYIIDKINSIFGYQIISKFSIKEVPTLIKTKSKISTKAINDTRTLNISIVNEDLKKSLLDLFRYI